ARVLSADWASRGACLPGDPDLFFPITSSCPALLQIAQAKAVCARCPVRIDCLSYALETGQDAGVRGGYHRRRAPGDPATGTPHVVRRFPRSGRIPRMTK